MPSKNTTAISGIFHLSYFFDQTARKPKVRLDTMAEMKPVQLNVRSEAEASATPVCPATQQQVGATGG